MNFEEFMNIIYLLKLLYEVEPDIFRETVNLGDLHFASDDGYYYDSIYETALEIADSLFAYVRNEYYDRRGINITVFSDPLVEEYFCLAGEYGKANGVSKARNPYFEKADEEMRRSFDFSYSLDWVLKGHTEPKRPYQSRFALFIDEYEYVDICGVAIGLLQMYQFFRETVQELKELLSRKERVAA